MKPIAGFVGIALAVSLWLVSAAQEAAVCGQDATAPNQVSLTTSQPANYEDFKRLLNERYDGKVLVTVVPGIYAGEQKKGMFGPGETSVQWYHFHQSVGIPGRIQIPGRMFPKRISDLHQLDGRTFGALTEGLNVTPLEKGEQLKVYKFYVYSGSVEFVLSVTGLGHMRDMDISKASRQVETTVRPGQVSQRVSVAGFGLVIQFIFDSETVMKAADYRTVVEEINKYLLPPAEAAQLASAGESVEIEPGMTEEAVIQKLGQPIQSVKFGAQKSLKYKNMTVILKDGKVADVKLE